METKARISDISKDFRTGKTRILFTCDYASPEEIERLADKDIRLKAVQWREKRSLDSNGYLWILCEKIAQEIDSTKDEIYELMLQRYGTLDRDVEDNIVTFKYPIGRDISAMEGHFRFYQESEDGETNIFVKIKGSSKYDTKEMSVLLSGVVDEAKELGIETLPPDELERIKAAWQPKAS